MSGDDGRIGVDVLRSEVLGNRLGVCGLVSVANIRVLRRVVETCDGSVGFIIVFVYIGVGGSRPSVTSVVTLPRVSRISVRIVIDTSTGILDQTAVDGAIARDGVLARVAQKKMFGLMISGHILHVITGNTEPIIVG